MAEQWQDNSITAAEIKDDDEAPDDWEAELEEKPEKPVVEEKQKEPVKPAAATKSKTTKKKTHEHEKIIKEPDGDYTPEEMDEILKRREIQVEQDKLDMAAELVESNGEHLSLDHLTLVTKEEFLNYSFRLNHRLEHLSKSEFYPEFVENFINGITKSMSIDGVKRLQATLQAIYLRKQSDEREKKSKSKAKKQAKPQLKTGRRVDYGAFGEEEQDFDQDVDYDDDDFM